MDKYTQAQAMLESARREMATLPPDDRKAAIYTALGQTLRIARDYQTRAEVEATLRDLLDAIESG